MSVFKRCLSAVLAAFLMIMSLSVLSSADSTYTKKTSEIGIRDPFVLVYDGKYYMYGTGLASEGYGCVVSEDLENWSDRIRVFAKDGSFDGDGNYWAPECHLYNGNFYLFATYHSKVTGFRGVGIFRSDSPTGPFSLISNGHITPHTRDCIDGTLYIDPEGQPWMVYVNEWTSNENGVGTMAAAKMSSDLTEFISEPVELFAADGHLWTDSKVTDGPFMYTTSEGRLFMIWSNSCKSGGYAVGGALSSDNTVTGKWIHRPKAIYRRDKVNQYDGGHGMLFTDLDGKLMMAIHSPNSSDPEKGIFETAKFIEMTDTGYEVRPASENSLSLKISDFLIRFYYSFLNFFSFLFK